jgi:hypothetical protein
MIRFTVALAISLASTFSFANTPIDNLFDEPQQYLDSNASTDACFATIARCASAVGLTVVHPRILSSATSNSERTRLRFANEGGTLGSCNNANTTYTAECGALNRNVLQGTYQIVCENGQLDLTTFIYGSMIKNPQTFVNTCK